MEEEALEVKSYPNAKCFKESILLTTPDIIIMDVMLPDGNGLDICSDMKSNPNTASIPIIMMSANNEILKMKEGCKAEEYIAKPFDINHFLSTVEKFVNQSTANA